MILLRIKVDGDFCRSSQTSTARTPLSITKLSKFHCKVATLMPRILSLSLRPRTSSRSHSR